MNAWNRSTPSKCYVWSKGFHVKRNFVGSQLLTQIVYKAYEWIAFLQLKNKSCIM